MLNIPDDLLVSRRDRPVRQQPIARSIALVSVTALNCLYTKAAERGQLSPSHGVLDCNRHDDSAAPRPPLAGVKAPGPASHLLPRSLARLLIGQLRPPYRSVGPSDGDQKVMKRTT